MPDQESMHKLIAELGILNERLGNLITTFDKHVIKNDRTLEDFDKRILILEKWQIKICTGFAVVTIFIQLLIGFLK